jgi:Carboxypeptidase regulatory-like domain/TonB-dependent Receptor Plug Domain/TonB dependent receptor
MVKQILRVCRFLETVACLFVSLCSLSHAQEASSAGIVGRVTDATEAAIPNASVVVTNLGTNAQRTAVSDALGDFSVPNLPPARYQVKVEKTGFQVAIMEPFELRIGEIARRSVRMTVGGVSESVMVRDEAPLMQTDTGTVGQVIDQKKIADLPLNGRNLVQLAALSAGVSPRQSLQRGTTQYGERNEYVQIEGGRDGSTNYVIDGVYVRSLRFNNLSLQPSLDTIQEFNVLRNAFSSEYGQGQAIVTAVTKSGTNELHGSAYEYLRNDVMDARNFFAATKPAYRRNQFGATGGGPVIKNKFFVFGGYEGLRTRQGRPFLGVVPDPALLTGNLSSVTSPIVDPLSGAPFPNNQIPSDRISRFANVLSPTIPAPNITGKNNFLIGKTFLDDNDTVTFRSDQVLSGKHTLFERYIWYDGSQISPSAFSQINFPQSAQNLSVGETYVATASIVNEFRLGYNRANHLNAPISLQGKNWDQLIGLRNLAGGTDPIDLGRPSWTIAGFTGQGEPTNTQGAIENIYSLSDSLSKVWGKHTIRTGVQVQNRRFNHLTDTPSRGSFQFTGLFTGNAIADYLLGDCSTCQGALGSSRSAYRSNTFSPFFVDVWQVSSRLTLDLGIRYEYLAPWQEQHNLEGAFNPVLGKIGYHKVPANIPSTLAPLIINQDGVYPAGIISPDKNNWAPRVGLAYRPTNRMVIRSGFGVYYDNLNLNELQFTRLVSPFYGSFTLIPDKSSPVSVDTLFPDLSQVSRFPAPFSVSPDNRTPYTMQWNFNIQQTLWRDLLVEVAYTGSGSHKLTKRWNQNQADFGTTPINSRIPYPAFDPGILTSTNDANASFNAFSIRAEKRYSNGLYMLGNYQFSKNLDNNSGEVEANDTSFRTNKKLDRSLSRYDQRHRAVIDYGYELPLGAGKKWLAHGGPAGFILGNWQAQGILTLLSGFPFTPTGPAVCNCGSFVPQRVVAVKPGFGKLDNPTVNHWYDVSAFALPAAGFQGNAGRNVIRGPGLRAFDFSLLKNFPINERSKIQFRTEFFNLTNHPNFGFPDSNIANATAGVISSAYDGRSIQMGLRLAF